MGTFFLGLLIIAALLFFYAISIYNGLIRLIEAINNNKKQIFINFILLRLKGLGEP